MTTKNLQRTASGKTVFAKVGIWKDSSGAFLLTFPEAKEHPIKVSQAEHPKLFARLTETVERAEALTT